MKSTKKFACDVCGREVGREHIVAKQVAFRRVGKHGAHLRTRNVAWLCDDRCLQLDPDYNQTPYMGAPSQGEPDAPEAVSEEENDLRGDADRGGAPVGSLGVRLPGQA